MKNFYIVNCRNNNIEEPLINLCDKSSMVIKNGIFRENVGLTSIIRVNEFCSLEMVNSKFEANQRSNEFYNQSTCIEASSDSILKMENCNFVNHIQTNRPYEDSGFVILTQGNTSVINCNFKNNNNHNLRAPLIAFKVIM